MHRDGSDTANMQPGDFLCDFCEREWDGAFPLVEGHKGSLICGRCLTVAYLSLGEGTDGTGAESAQQCVMCLQETEDGGWHSPVREAWICQTCIKRCAGSLHKDPDWDWTKPGSQSQ